MGWVTLRSPVFGALMGTLALAACAAEQDTSGGRGSPGTNGSAVAGGTGQPGTGSSSSGGMFGNSSGTTTADTTMVRNPNALPGAMGTTTIKSSFIWIANSAEGTVSKLDTRTMTELGRYMTSPNGRGLPSRTTVSADGDVAVANRGNATGQLAGDGGGITKIYADDAKCQDKNGNGTIDTSTGRMDVKPWLQDECVAWHTPINHFSNRPVAWAPPPAPDAQPKLWTSGASMCDQPACTVEVFRLNGDTGAIEDTVQVTGLAGVDFITAAGPGSLMGVAGLIGTFLPLILNYGAYGAASDAGGNLWLFIANTTQLVRVDALTLQWRVWPTPMGNGYGITIDKNGRVFVCGTLGLSRFDPATETWQNNFSAVDLGFNGCMTDGGSVIWVGGGSDQGVTGLFGFNADTLELVDQVNMDDMGRPMNVKGVSVDVDYKIWGVSSPGADMTGAGNLAWRFDPMTREVASYDGLNGAYSYSDMTGFGLTHAGVQEPPPVE
jgi:streptogramin lyase